MSDVKRKYGSAYSILASILNCKHFMAVERTDVQRKSHTAFIMDYIWDEILADQRMGEWSSFESTWNNSGLVNYGSLCFLPVLGVESLRGWTWLGVESLSHLQWCLVQKALLCRHNLVGKSKLQRGFSLLGYQRLETRPAPFWPMSWPGGISSHWRSGPCRVYSSSAMELSWLPLWMALNIDCLIWIAIGLMFY